MDYLFISFAILLSVFKSGVLRYLRWKNHLGWSFKQWLECSICLLHLACYYCFTRTSNLGCPWIDFAEALEVRVSTVGNLGTGLRIAQARKAINCECETIVAP